MPLLQSRIASAKPATAIPYVPLRPRNPRKSGGPQIPHRRVLKPHAGNFHALEPSACLFLTAGRMD